MVLADMRQFIKQRAIPILPFKKTETKTKTNQEKDKKNPITRPFFYIYDDLSNL